MTDIIKQEYDIFDLAKFILSFFVMAIHAHIVPFFLSPFVRLAVPLYFVISSYLLFMKKKLSKNSARGGILIRFIKRNISLYLFWLAILLPIDIIYNDWHLVSFPEGIFKIASNILFRGFPASWYIPALVIGAAVLYYIPKKFNVTMFLGASFLYMFCCIDSNYYNLFSTQSFIITIDDIFTRAVNDPRTSFLVSFIWMGIGKAFAENCVVFSCLSRRMGIMISAILVSAECIIVNLYGLARKDDCYVFMIPLCIYVFDELKESRLRVKFAVTLRKMSTIIYCLHYSVILCIRKILVAVIGHENNFVVYAFTAGFCLAACFLILRLESKTSFKWLRYSH